MRRAAIAVIVMALAAGASCVRAQEEIPPVDTCLTSILPADVYTVPGVEMNVYFDSIVLHPQSELLLWDVDCNMGLQQNDRWTCMPTDAEVGDHLLTIKVISPEVEVLLETQTTVHVIAPAAGAGAEMTMLCVGASQTGASKYTARLVELFAADEAANVRLIGESGPGGDTGNRHEGYGGWTWDAFANRWDAEAEWREIDGRNRRVRSPFLFEVGGEPQLDFQRYLDKNNDGNPPDFITILLGGNDTFSATEETIEARIDLMFANMDKLMAELRRVAPDTEIGIVYLMPPSREQDSFGANYRCTQTRWQYRRNMQRVIKRQTEMYLGSDDEHFSVVPAFVNLDPVWGFPGVTAPPNPHSADATRRMSNGLHPNQAGYYQMGDAFYCWAKSRLASIDEQE